MRWAGHVARVEEGDVYTGFLWGNGRKETVGTPRLTWEDNIKGDLEEVGWEAWTGSSWLR